MDDLSDELYPGVRNFLSPSEKKRFRYLKKFEKNYDWKEEDVIYDINSLGYRSCEFDTETPCNVYLGCSHVLGEGLPLEDTFAYLINKELNDFPLYNLGARGASPEDCFRRLKTFLDLNIQRVIFFVPYRGRRSFYVHGKWQTVSVSQDLRAIKNSGHLFKSLYSHEYEIFMNDLAAYATESLCRQNNIPYYCINQETVRTEIDWITDARDLSHFGKSTHKVITNKFLDIIK